jgi:hypothetical protein
MRPSRGKPTVGFVEADNKHWDCATALKDVLSTRTRLVRHRLTYADFRAGLPAVAKGARLTIPAHPKLA